MLKSHCVRITPYPPVLYVVASFFSLYKAFWMWSVQMGLDPRSSSMKRKPSQLWKEACLQISGHSIHSCSSLLLFQEWLGPQKQPFERHMALQLEGVGGKAHYVNRSIHGTYEPSNGLLDRKFDLQSPLAMWKQLIELSNLMLHLVNVNFNCSIVGTSEAAFYCQTIDLSSKVLSMLTSNGFPRFQAEDTPTLVWRC